MRALSTLPPGELHIIRRRFFTEKVPNRAVLGREIGLSKERVRQLEARALSRLKLLLQPFQEPSSPTNATEILIKLLNILFEENIFSARKFSGT